MTGRAGLAHEPSPFTGSAAARLSLSRITRPILIIGVAVVSTLIAGSHAAADTRTPAVSLTTDVATLDADLSEPPVRRSVRYSPPVSVGIKDPFRMPNGPFGAGNRGIEYTTIGGEVVTATANGIVVFAGQVGGRLAMTLRHLDGRLSSLTNVVSIRVAKGDVVLGGEVIATAAPGLHFGVRENGHYVDPMPLFSDTQGRRSGRSYLVEGSGNPPLMTARGPLGSGHDAMPRRSRPSVGNNNPVGTTVSPRPKRAKRCCH